MSDLIPAGLWCGAVRGLMWVAPLCALLAAGCATTPAPPPTTTPTAGPLADAPVLAAIVTRDSIRARRFYEGVLGLRFVSEDDLALVLSSDEALVHIHKLPEHQPAPYAVLGWTVKDIRGTVARLTQAGVRMERYDWLPVQDDRGIATLSNGSQVAWFRDPDRNVLTLVQRP